MNPLDIDHWWHALVAFAPALLATILIFLDQQITAVIVNRKEHKLKVVQTQIIVSSILSTKTKWLGFPFKEIRSQKRKIAINSILTCCKA